MLSSTLGQGLQTSSYDGEVIFSIIIVIVGLTLFAQLLGKMQVRETVNFVNSWSVS